MCKKREERVGESYVITSGCVATIIKVLDGHKVQVQMDDGKILDVYYNHLKRGKVRNPNFKNLYGVAKCGIGRHLTNVDDKPTKVYGTWKGMIDRCYNPKNFIKRPTYEGCSVCEEWLTFQVFADWFELNYNPETMDRWHLDKDIIVKNNRIYSPETCAFVPNQVNILFTKLKNSNGLPRGVRKTDSGKYSSRLGDRFYFKVEDTPEEAFKAYKEAKENRIKEVADKWKDLIDIRVYDAMQNYSVEIQD